MPADFDYKMTHGNAHVHVTFIRKVQKLQIRVALSLVNFGFRDTESMEETVLRWDRQLFYEEQSAELSEAQFQAKQLARLWKQNLYPNNLNLRSLELQWKLVTVDFQSRALSGHLISSRQIGIAELREEFGENRKKWSGFLPVGGDDYAECLTRLSR